MLALKVDQSRVKLVRVPVMANSGPLWPIVPVMAGSARYGQPGSVLITYRVLAYVSAAGVRLWPVMTYIE